MKLVPLFFLGLLPLPVMAAMPNLTARQIVWDVVICIGLAVIFGILIFLIRKAPFIPPDVKQWIEYLLYALVALAIIFFILTLLGL